MNTNLLRNLNRYTDLLWGEYAETYPQIIRLNPPKIILNARLRTTAGCCDIEKNTIELATRFFTRNREAMFNQILPHEIAHQIDYNLNGLPKNNRWHHAAWVEIMVNLGQRPNPYHTLKA